MIILGVHIRVPGHDDIVPGGEVCRYSEIVVLIGLVIVDEFANFTGCYPGTVSLPILDSHPITTTIIRKRNLARSPTVRSSSHRRPKMIKPKNISGILYGPGYIAIGIVKNTSN